MLLASVLLHSTCVIIVPCCTSHATVKVIYSLSLLSVISFTICSFNSYCILFFREYQNCKRAPGVDCITASITVFLNGSDSWWMDNNHYYPLTWYSGGYLTTGSASLAWRKCMVWQEAAWLPEPFLSTKFMRQITNDMISLFSLPLSCSTSAQYRLPVSPGEIWKWLRTDFQGNKLTSLVL